MEKQFKQIVCVDNTNLQPWALEKLARYSEKPIKLFNEPPASDAEIVERIGDADAFLVSWGTKISANVIEQAPNLQYIGMCCSLYSKESANVDIDAAEKRGITVKGVRDYGDEGVVEFVFAQLINLGKGMGKHQWKPKQTELKGKTLGIIGMGTLGSMVAQVAVAFGMDVLYFSRTRKPDLETVHIRYAPLEELLPQADAITTHLPRNTHLLGKKEFDLMKPNSVLINTSLGATYEIDAFSKWASQAGNFAIVDIDGALGNEAAHQALPNVICIDRISGMTDAAFRRLSEKVLANVEEYLTL
ncbi:NAD(P)-dependent oxidoreductase [Flammeovirgaceae bacterium SG7u.111]|nr:NAD(P)-dependent oxidoreductase [Flammeovirgaceae bacterium SG7u.132]WPO36291.1 NAD(P)-dependent oxidoreductase [Flammeovirgaceae bacterium SG7u.111]